MNSEIKICDRPKIDHLSQDVIKFVTSQACLSRELARHFGDEDSVSVNSGCGHCQFCLTKVPIKFTPAESDQKSSIDEGKIKAILSACKVRDDARFLARVAFGILSPRVTTEKLSKHDVFGSMNDCAFEVRMVPCFSVTLLD